MGTRWSNTITEKKEITAAFDIVSCWSKENRVPINMGEYGAYYKADLSSRILWTSFISQLADSYGFSRHYWEFCSGFGIYDPVTEKWNKPLLNALLTEINFV